jgi:hypothetical protein
MNTVHTVCRTCEDTEHVRMQASNVRMHVRMQASNVRMHVRMQASKAQRPTENDSNHQIENPCATVYVK